MGTIEGDVPVRSSDYLLSQMRKIAESFLLVWKPCMVLSRMRVVAQTCPWILHTRILHVLLLFYHCSRE